MKYLLVYYAEGKDYSGLYQTHMSLNYKITKTNIKRVELRLKKGLSDANLVRIISFKEVSN